MEFSTNLVFEGYNLFCRIWLPVLKVVDGNQKYKDGSKCVFWDPILKLYYAAVIL